MDIKQQTQNVAAQGRFGDSMLLHVNPAEVKGLAQAMPITVNPQTGQPEAFLPFLAPVLGAAIAPAILAGTGLSAAAMAGIGAGLATYAQTGGSGSKALLSGLTAGMGTKALGTAAGGTGAPVDQSAFASMKDIFTQTPGGGTNKFDIGVKTLADAAMTPSGIVAGVSAGTQGVMASQEQFEREMAQLQLDEEERKRKMYENYPEQIPIASGGSTSFADGGKTGYRRGQNVYYDPRQTNDFNPSSDGSLQFMARRARPIPSGFMPGFSPEFRYFQGDDPTTYLTRYASNISQPQNTEALPPMLNYGGFRPPMPVQPPFMGGRGFRPFTPRFGGFGNPFMQTSSYQSFYGNPQTSGMYNPYARFNTQPIPSFFPQPFNPPVNTPPPSDVPPPSDGGDLPPPDGPIVPPIDDNIGRKGRTKIEQPIAPPDNFITPGPVATGPVNPPITPEPTITLPIEGGADVTIPDFTKINTTNPRDNFMSIGGPGGEINKPMPDPVRVFPGSSPTFNERGPVFTPPSPAAPFNTPMTPPTGFKPMGSMPMFGAPMFSGGGDTNVEVDKLPEGLKAMYDSGPKGKEGVEKIAAKTDKFDAGGPTDMMQDPIVQETIRFILGESDNEDIIMIFVNKYGTDQFRMLRDSILKEAANNPNAQTEGLITGRGNSGMADDLSMSIGADRTAAAVSQDEYIIPADVVSMLGDGSSDAGSKQLDGMLDRVRMAKTGGTTQAEPIEVDKVLPA